MKERDTQRLIQISFITLHAIFIYRKVNQSFLGTVTLRYRENVTDSVTVLLLEG